MQFIDLPNGFPIEVADTEEAWALAHMIWRFVPWAQITFAPFPDGAPCLIYLGPEGDAHVRTVLSAIIAAQGRDIAVAEALEEIIGEDRDKGGAEDEQSGDERDRAGGEEAEEA